MTTMLQPTLGVGKDSKSNLQIYTNLIREKKENGKNGGSKKQRHSPYFQLLGEKL